MRLRRDRRNLSGGGPRRTPLLKRCRLPDLREQLPLALLVIAVVGLTASCHHGGSASDAPNEPEPVTLALAEIATGMDRPVQITHAGDNSGRLFVVEQRGIVTVLDGNIRQATPFLDISGRVGSTGPEQGLLGIAFPPDYAAKGYFYADYTDLSGDTIVARFHLSATGAGTEADPASEERLLRVEQPFANHNGGQLAFGPDGFLYIGLGDGGGSGDPQGNGQALDTLLGKILRLDVEDDPGELYLIPADNPYAGAAGRRGEIWAYGLRNPWRFSFDRLTGDLYIADVGQNRYEEINFQPAAAGGGENYGWNLTEGVRCYPESVQDCSLAGLTLPVTIYNHDAGDCAVTGGFVYRGTVYPDLQGIYIYGDFCTGRIRGLSRSGAEWSDRLLLETALGISTFGEDEEGNLYVADYATGNIYGISSQK